MRENSGDATPDATRTLSEVDSMAWVGRYGIALARHEAVADGEAAVAAAERLGFPVVLKLCGDALAHKSERALVHVGLGDAHAVRAAAEDLLGRARPEDGAVVLLVAERVEGRRELLAGMLRDPQFGPCVMLGLGGTLAEAFQDVAFATAPLTPADAKRLLLSLRSHKLFSEPFRGEPAVDFDALAQILVGLGQLATEHPEVRSVDLNPLILRGAQPVAVDALVEVGEPAAPSEAPDERSDAVLLERFAPLFHPRGIAVVGVSGHPGKFGFVTLHNLLRFGYRGNLFGIKPDGAEVLGMSTLGEVAALPDGAADLAFLCTPNAVNEQVLRDCAAKGVRAAFVASGGYSEAGEEGIARQRSLVATAEELDMVLIGPNGQGVISTGDSMCAQIVAPYPPAGRIGVASQSGNLVSSFLNYAVVSGVGVSKAVSLGNSAQTGLAEMLAYFAADPETAVVVAYLEGVSDGPRFARAVERITAKKPLVLVKGGRAEGGRRAAASHTGALASDDRVFEGVCRQRGVLLAESVEEAFEWAATLATQPLPAGARTVVLTTAGGWGVLAADACTQYGLELAALPADLREVIDTMVPARWSRNNPIDLAGGETRDTVPELLERLCAHPEIDAVLHLGLGIQSAQAQAFRGGAFFPDFGLERIAAYHEKQDRRYALAGEEASLRHGKSRYWPRRNSWSPTATTATQAPRRCVKRGGSATRALTARYRPWRRSSSGRSLPAPLGRFVSVQDGGVDVDAHRAVIRAQGIGPEEGPAHEGHGRRRGQHHVDAPAHVAGPHAEALAPPRVVVRPRFEGPEGVGPPGGQPAVDLRAFLGQKAAVLGVGLGAGEVDFSVGRVEVAHHENALAAFSQALNPLEQGAVEVELVGDAVLVAALGKVAVHHREAAETGDLQAPLPVEAFLAESALDPVGGAPAEEPDAAIALAFGGGEVAVPAREGADFFGQIFFEGADLLQADDLGPALGQPREEALLHAGPESVDVPGHDAQSFLGHVRTLRSVVAGEVGVVAQAFALVALAQAPADSSGAISVGAARFRGCDRGTGCVRRATWRRTGRSARHRPPHRRPPRARCGSCRRR